MNTEPIITTPSPPPPGDEVQRWLVTRRLLGAPTGATALRRMKPARTGRLLRIRCDRSLPFEFVDEFLDAFLDTWGAHHRTTYSDYDPGLAQIDAPGVAADLRVIFLDWRLVADRLSPAEAAAWVSGRAHAAIRAGDRRAPVLLNNWPVKAGDPREAWMRGLNDALAALPGQLPGLTLIDLEAVRAELAGEFFDSRNDAVSKFPFASAAAIAIARHLGADLFPSLVGERIKALVLDLDDTLWRGVLGEEGPDNLGIEAGHAELHQLLKALRARGILLTLCSRNQLADVEAVFRSRPELGLSLADFASVKVNWSRKVDNLAAIAAELNIDPSAMLFVDDNDSEIAKAAGAIPGLRTLLADPSGVETAKALRHYPGLFAVGKDSAASVRTEDIRANRGREELRSQAGDLNGYLAALKMEIGLHRTHRPHLLRVHELSNKTNQFNLALARLSASETEEAFGADHLTMTVSLKDALSDSGLVGVLIARVEGELATVREVLFSCRVLGREVETISLLWLCGWLEERGAKRIRFTVTEGPRNQPARDWLKRFLPEGTEAAIPEVKARAEQACRTHPAAVLEHR